MTPNELDRLAALNGGHTLKLEDGRRTEPTLTTLRRIAAVFGISVGYLSDGEGRAPEREEVIESVWRARKRLLNRRVGA